MKSFLLSVSLIMIAASASSQKSAFVRVFDENDHKIHSGFLSSLQDSSFTLIEHKKVVTIPVNNTGKIKLRRSFGHTVLITAGITATIGIILGAASADPNAWIFGYTASEGALLGAVTGATFGTVLGALIGGTRRRPVFLVDRSQKNWIKIKDLLGDYTNRVK